MLRVKSVCSGYCVILVGSGWRESNPGPSLSEDKYCFNEAGTNKARDG